MTVPSRPGPEWVNRRPSGEGAVEHQGERSQRCGKERAHPSDARMACRSPLP
jgi:hypothetical protein